jgi:hypothetical protein
MGTVLGYTLLIGLGSFRLTESYKEATRRIGLQQPGWWKSFVNLCCCTALVLLAMHQATETRVLMAVAASGVAALLHALDTLMRSQRDQTVSEVLERQRPRRR